MPEPTEPPTGAPVPTAPTGRVAAFFDVDNTIIRGASSFHLAVGLYRRAFFQRSDIVRFAVHQFRYLTFGENRQQIDEVRQRALEIMHGRSVAEVVAIAEDIYDEVLSLRIFPGTQRLLDQHLRAGHEVWLVTATPVEIADIIARRLGATGALGTIAEHKDGFYTGRLVGDLLHGRAKAEAVRALAEREGLDLERSFAYGDSTNDVPILSEVGFPCAINPDRRLRKHAAEVGWPMREFRGRRNATRRGVDAATVAGSVWVLGLVVRTARRAIRARWGVR
ncbi:HAD-IB family hydrolase [Cellulomonas sp. ACRRI]|uniref:HAD family hydrolase n=1 Tax=Cellulomonas sp. ACRRI TaxID=2918188 RepID=UPI001EF19982|nr:HAD-IB family hydrolase [Cellulomonas sp. ACRRI]MCG7286828.1 HAD-IB family hydrolase [Cellulomonas sp. ACRRI]